MNNPTRFIGAMAPVITIFDGRYTLEQLTKRIQEVMIET